MTRAGMTRAGMTSRCTRVGFSVPATIPHFVSVKVVGGKISGYRESAFVAVLRIEMVIDITSELILASILGEQL